MTDTPKDYADPDWHSQQMVHCWRNYISDEVIALWPTFTDEQKAAIARQAESFADREEWE